MIVTDSWIIVTGMYRIRVSQQADVRVAVVKTDTHAVSHLTYVPFIFPQFSLIFFIFFSHFSSFLLNFFSSFPHVSSFFSKFQIWKVQWNWFRDPGAGGVQFLTILVENIARNIPAFTIRLNSMDYRYDWWKKTFFCINLSKILFFLRDLRAKLQAPIEKARDIMIHQSLSERFVQAFVNHARENPRYPVSAEARTSLDPCIGCMQVCQFS